MQPADLLRAKEELSILVRPFVRQSVPHRRSRFRDIPSVHTVSAQAQKKWNKLIEAHAKLEIYRQEPENTNNFAFTVSANKESTFTLLIKVGYFPVANRRSTTGKGIWF